MFCIVSAVQSIHKSNAIHRNIAPESVYLSHELALLGKMKDTVFLISQRRTRTSQVGSHLYAAPEVYQREQHYDYKADIWSIGMTCLALSRGEMTMQPAQLSTLSDEILDQTINVTAAQQRSHSYRDFVRACLRVNPDNRATIDELN